MAVEKQEPITEDIIEETEVESLPGNEEVDVAVEGEEVMEEAPSDDFNVNLAESMDERTLGSMARELIAEYKKDKTSRKDW